MTFKLWDVYFGPVFKYLSLMIMIVGMLGFIISSIRGYLVKIPRESKIFLLLYVVTNIAYILNVLFWIKMKYVFDGLYMYVFYQLIFLSAYQAIKVIEISEIFDLVRVMGAIIALLACYEVIIGVNFIPDESGYLGIMHGVEIVTRARVFSGSFLTLGMLLSCTTIVSFYYYIKNKSITNMILMIINFVGILMTSSRGPLVSTIVGFLVIWILLNPINTRRTFEKITLLMIIFLFIVIVLLLIKDKLLSNEYINYQFQRVLSILNWSSDHSNLQRQSIWRDVIGVIKQNWVMGIGIGATGPDAINNYGITVTESGILRRFVELGVFGATLYYCMMVYIISKYIRNIIKQKTEFSVLAMAIIFAILTEDIILQISDSIIINSIFWMCIAILVKENTYLNDSKIDYR